MTGTITQAQVDQALNINETANQAVNAIRGNGDLTQDARVRGIATAYVRADRQMTQLRESMEGNAAKVKDDLMRSVFGSVSAVGQDAISARDADDRAAQIEDPAEANSLLERAETNGDTVLARAIALRAFTEFGSLLGGKAWGAVLESYAARHPGSAAKMDDLMSAGRGPFGGSIVANWTFLVPKPPEVEAMSPTLLWSIQDSA